MSIEFNNEHIPKSISTLYLDETSADVKFTFESDSDVVPAHKAILGSASSVFYAMFFGSLKEGDVVNITDASVEGFKEFIQFFYKANLTVNLEHLEEIVRLADKYDITDHLKSCVKNWINLKNQSTDEKMLLGYKIAHTLDDHELKAQCEETICESNNLFESDAILKLEQPILKNILAMNLVCKEIDIFKGCIKWAINSCKNNNFNENDPKMLRRQLGDCFQFIRFPAMDQEDLGEIMKNNLYAGLFNNDELIDLMRVSTVQNFKSNIFENTKRRQIEPTFQFTAISGNIFPSAKCLNCGRFNDGPAFPCPFCLFFKPI